MSDEKSWALVSWGEAEVPFVFGVGELQEALDLLGTRPSWPVICDHPGCPLVLGRIVDPILHTWEWDGERAQSVLAQVHIDAGAPVNLDRLRLRAVVDRQTGQVSGFTAPSH